MEDKNIGFEKNQRQNLPKQRIDTETIEKEIKNVSDLDKTFEEKLAKDNPSKLQNMFQSRENVESIAENCESFLQTSNIPGGDASRFPLLLEKPTTFSNNQAHDRNDMSNFPNFKNKNYEIKTFESKISQISGKAASPNTARLEKRKTQQASLRKSYSEFKGKDPKNETYLSKMPIPSGCSMTGSEKLRLQQLMQDDPIEPYIFDATQDTESSCVKNREIMKKLDEINLQLEQFKKNQETIFPFKSRKPYLQKRLNGGKNMAIENSSKEHTCLELEQYHCPMNDKFEDVRLDLGAADENEYNYDKEYCDKYIFPESEDVVGNKDDTNDLKKKSAELENEIEEMEKSYNKKMEEITNELNWMKQEAEREVASFLNWNKDLKDNGIDSDEC